jgi:hypothetical protein
MTYRIPRIVHAAALGIGLAFSVPPAFSQDVQEGTVQGPTRPGQSQIVVSSGGKTRTLTVRTNCEAASTPMGRWTLFPKTGGRNLILTFDEDLTYEVIATYDHAGGEIRGKYSNAELDGFWSQTGSNEKCPIPSADGKDHWGNARMVFNSSHDLFSGTWNYCGKAATEQSWIGVRDCPEKPFQPTKRAFVHNATLYAHKVDKTFDDRKIAAYGWFKTAWVCDAKGLRPQSATRPIIFRRAYRLEVTGALTTPVRYLDGAGVQRKSRWEYEVFAEMLAAESEITPPLDFWSVPSDLLKLTSERNLKLLLGLAKGGNKFKKFIEAVTDNNSTSYRHIFRVRCKKTPNKRFDIYLDPITTFPSVTSKGDLTWRDGAHGSHKEYPFRQ